MNGHRALSAMISGRKKLQDRVQTTFDLGQTVAGVSPHKLFERHAGGHGRRLLFQAAAGAGQRQAFDQEQMLDPHHLLDVCPPVNPGTAGSLRDPQLWELALPGAQHVRLHLQQIADLGRAKQGALRNLNLS